jgi:hypothetical protein
MRAAQGQHLYRSMRDCERPGANRTNDLNMNETERIVTTLLTDPITQSRS